MDTYVVENDHGEATIVTQRPPRAPALPVPVILLNADHGSAAAHKETAATDVRSFDKEEITIGRGSRQISVDLKLEGDLEVSRKHATLSRRPDGTFIITCHGANSILFGGSREVTTGETAEV